jgi:hypothetical protein
MKYKQLHLAGCIIAALVISAGGVFAQDSTHAAAMSALTGLLAAPATSADSLSKDPEALKAAQLITAFPPHIQKRLGNVILMIVQESGANPNKPVDSMRTSGPEGAFQSFSPAVQQEIQAIARELEQDPEFMKKAGMLK